jgi:PAS domain S-box-containing protein
LVFAGYYIGAQLGFALTFQTRPVSVLWPPNSILCAALLLSPYRIWWFLILCALPAHFLIEVGAGVPFSMAVCWFVSNVSEAVIGAAATRLLAGPSARFGRIRTMGILCLCAALIAPFLSSFLDAAFVLWNKWGHQSYWQVWTARFCSNVFTEIIIAPAIVIWATTRFRFERTAAKLRYLEGALMSIGLAIASAAVFYWQTAGAGTYATLLYAPLPFLVWAAVRFGQTGGSAAVLWVALLAIWGAVHGRGPFISDSPEQNALSIQVFFTLVSCTLLFLSTSVAERRQAEERFAKVFGSSPDATIVTRLEDGRIIDVNARWAELLGYARAETVGRTVFDLKIYPSNMDRNRLIAGVLKTGHLRDVEMVFRTKTGEFRHVLISANVDEIEGESCLIIIIRDFTDRKRAEEAERKLAHASRLAMAGELTAMVAHEVKQPLGAILSNAETAEILLQSKNPPLDEVRQIVSDIRESDLRADAAVRRISDLLRKRELNLESLDVNELISDMLHLTAADASRRRISIQRNDDGSLPPALGDRVHLQQVLLNLILNGMDAVEEQPEPRRRITIAAKQSGREIEVSVSDAGGGIPPDKLPRIFESFFTTKKAGMGLGLSIARSVIQAHKGRIWAENNPEGGATVHFTIRTAENNDGPGTGKPD